MTPWIQTDSFSSSKSRPNSNLSVGKQDAFLANQYRRHGHRDCWQQRRVPAEYRFAGGDELRPQFRTDEPAGQSHNISMLAIILTAALIREREHGTQVEAIVGAGEDRQQKGHGHTRLIGSIRLQCLDHVVVLRAAAPAPHTPLVYGVLQARGPISLNKDAPLPRILPTPILGGLHQ
jgi:hypothetical protein